MDQSGSEAVDLTTLLHPESPEKEVVPEAQTAHGSGTFTAAMLVVRWFVLVELTSLQSSDTLFGRFIELAAWLSHVWLKSLVVVLRGAAVAATAAVLLSA